MPASLAPAGSKRPHVAASPAAGAATEKQARKQRRALDNHELLPRCLRACFSVAAPAAGDHVRDHLGQRPVVEEREAGAVVADIGVGAVRPCPRIGRHQELGAGRGGCLVWVLTRSKRSEGISGLGKCMMPVNSRTLSNMPGVSAETRLRVLSAINELQYTPNAAARSLRSGESKIIGLMIPDAFNPHFWDTVSGAEEEAIANGYSLILATTSMDRQRERQAFQALLDQRLDGIIPLFTYPEEFIEELKLLKQRGIPCVVSRITLPDQTPNVDVVWSHYEEAAKELMEHLLGLGHRRIGYIHGVGRSELGSERLDIYRNMLQAAGTYDKNLEILCGYTLEDGFRAAEHFIQMKPRPTAIIGLNDLLAFGAMQAILQHGLRIPEDISVAGFDDLPMSRLLSPPLTSGRADGAETGRQCVRLLLARLNNPDLPPQQVHLSTKLIVRDSTGPCPEYARLENKERR